MRNYLSYITNSRVLLICLLLIIQGVIAQTKTGVHGTTPNQKTNKKQQTERISGQIIDMETNTQGVVTQIAVIVETIEDFEYYNIVLDQKGSSLLKHIGSMVEIEGIVSEKSSNKWIQVSSFTILFSPEDTPADNNQDDD